MLRLLWIKGQQQGGIALDCLQMSLGDELTVDMIVEVWLYIEAQDR